MVRETSSDMEIIVFSFGLFVFELEFYSNIWICWLGFKCPVILGLLVCVTCGMDGYGIWYFLKGFGSLTLAVIKFLVFKERVRLMESCTSQPQDNA